MDPCNGWGFGIKCGWTEAHMVLGVLRHKQWRLVVHYIKFMYIKKLPVEYGSLSDIVYWDLMWVSQRCHCAIFILLLFQLLTFIFIFLFFSWYILILSFLMFLLMIMTSHFINDPNNLLQFHFIKLELLGYILFIFTPYTSGLIFCRLIVGLWWHVALLSI